MCGVLFFLSVFVVHGHCWPLSAESGLDNLPRLVISLLPSADALPEVSEVIGELDGGRESFEARMMQKVGEGYNAALQLAQGEIESTIDRVVRNSNFLKFPSNKGAVQVSSFLAIPKSGGVTTKVSVSPEEPMGSSVTRKIKLVEATRQDGETAFLEHGLAEMTDFVSLAIHELEEQIEQNLNARQEGNDGEHISATPASLFLEGIEHPEEKNIQVVPPVDTYPTPVSMVNDMEVRRDMSEKLERETIFALKIKLLDSVANMSKNALRRSLDNILQGRAQQ